MPPAIFLILGALALLLIKGVSGMTRGVKNNNPGNIKDNPSIKYVGEIGNDGVFVIFDTPENGLRALGVAVTHIFLNKGVSTLRQLGNIWAPSYDNPTTDNPADPTDDYGAQLGKLLNYNPDTPYPWTDRNMLQALIRAIVIKENGWQLPYTPTQYQTAALASLQYRGLA